jgi:hypothetical protein
MKRNEAMEVNAQAEESVEAAAGSADMAHECKEDVDAFIAEIKELLDAAENGNPEEEDDQIAEEAADECEKAA